MYADDTAIYVHGKKIENVCNMLNNDLKNVSNWLTTNKLSLNVLKTEYIVIGTHQRLKYVDNNTCNIRINDTPLNRVRACKHLGVVIDETLSWTQHIETIRRKALPGIFMLKKAKAFLGIHHLNMIYHSMVESHFDYCDVVWGQHVKHKNKGFKFFKIELQKLLPGQVGQILAQPH